MKSIPGKTLQKAWTELFRLLKQIAPLEERYDVEWLGPYFIPRPKAWHPSHFLLYNGDIYGDIRMGWETITSTWNITSGEIAYDRLDDERIWKAAMPQLVRRLHAALSNPESYNRRVRRFLPIGARTGKILRLWTWPRGTRPLLSQAGHRALDAACRRGAAEAAWMKLTRDDYLDLTAILYDAAFPDIGGLSPQEKYNAKADIRHGGMLDIDGSNPHAFKKWFTSGKWSGSHPWEIVYGYPHGILFSPILMDKGNWRFCLSVDTPGLYLETVKMAVALGKAGVPFSLLRKEDIAAALRGRDDVEIGPGYGQISVAQLNEVRPEGLSKVRWNPIPEILPISGFQRRRVEHVLHTGTPAGWEKREA